MRTPIALALCVVGLSACSDSNAPDALLTVDDMTWGFGKGLADKGFTKTSDNPLVYSGGGKEGMQYTLTQVDACNYKMILESPGSSENRVEAHIDFTDVQSAETQRNEDMGPPTSVRLLGAKFRCSGSAFMCQPMTQIQVIPNAYTTDRWQKPAFQHFRADICKM